MSNKIYVPNNINTFQYICVHVYMCIQMYMCIYVYMCMCIYRKKEVWIVDKSAIMGEISYSETDRSTNKIKQVIKI